MSNELQELLKTYSVLANKASGGSHPLDEGRWRDFVVKGHKEGYESRNEDIKNKMIGLGWSEEQAEIHENNYRESLELLKHYDRSQ